MQCTPKELSRMVLRSIHESTRDVARTETYETSRKNRKKAQMIVEDQKISRNTIAALMQAWLKNGFDQWFLLPAIACTENSCATDNIACRNGKRVISIRAYTNKSIFAPTEISRVICSADSVLKNSVKISN